MKILLTVHGYPPEKFGGTETYTRWLAHALNRRGHEVQVFTRTDSKGGEFELSSFDDGAVRVWRVRNTYSVYNEYQAHYSNPHVEEKFAEVMGSFKPDVAHFTYLLGGLSAGCVKVAENAGAKTIVTLTDFHHICAWGQLLTPDGTPCPRHEEGIGCCACFAGEDPYSGVSALRRFFIGFLPPKIRAQKLSAPGVKRMNSRINYLRDALNAAGLVIFPTEALGEQYRPWGVDGRHVPFGMDYGLFKNFNRTPSDKVRLLFIGQLRAHKGLHVLGETLRGLRDVPSWSLDVYASANSDDEKKYLAECGEGLGDRFIYRGNFPPDEIARVYENADVLVTPSIWTENSPLVILFAAATKTTLISADVGGIREVVGDWGYYYPPHDAALLRDILRCVITDPSARDRPGVPKIPSIDEHAEIMESIYNEI